MARATSPPISGTHLNKGQGSCRMIAKSPKECASALAVVSPTWVMPRAKRKRSKVVCRERSMAAIRFCAHLVAIFCGSNQSPAIGHAIRQSANARARHLHQTGPHPRCAVSLLIVGNACRSHGRASRRSMVGVWALVTRRSRSS